MADPYPVNSPRRVLSLSRKRTSSGSFPNVDDKGSGFGVSGQRGTKPAEVYGFVGSITTVVATAIFFIWAYFPEDWLHYIGIFYYPSSSTKPTAFYPCSESMKQHWQNHIPPQVQRVKVFLFLQQLQALVNSFQHFAGPGLPLADPSVFILIDHQQEAPLLLPAAVFNPWECRLCNGQSHQFAKEQTGISQATLLHQNDFK